MTDPYPWRSRWLISGILLLAGMMLAGVLGVVLLGGPAVLAKAFCLAGALGIAACFGGYFWMDERAARSRRQEQADMDHRCVEISPEEEGG